MDRDDLARALSERVQKIRLDRIAEPIPETSVPFDELPRVERDTWLDVADAVIDLYDQLRFAVPRTPR